MSTKKPAPVKEPKKKAEVIKPEPVKKPIKKSFDVGEYEATRFVFDENGKIKREYKKVHLSTEEDISKNPKRKDELLEQELEKSFKDGWEFDDHSAIEAAYKEIEHALAQGAVSVAYGDIKCYGCIAEKLRNLADAMKLLRLLKDSRRKIYQKIDTDKYEMPSILPSLDELDKWDVVDGKWTYVGPDVKVRQINLSKEQMHNLKSVLEKVIGEKLSDKWTLIDGK